MVDKVLNRLDFLLPIGAFACGLLLLLADPYVLQTLRNNVFDQYQRGSPRIYETVPVRIVDIDEESLARLGQWPWPRTRLARLVHALSAAGAAAIGFDFIFAEEDRSSPRAMAEIWPLGRQTREELHALPDHDRVFAQSLAGTPAVLGFALERQRRNESGSERHDGKQAADPLTQPYRYVNSGPPPTPWLHRFEFVVAALPVLQNAAQGNGALTFVPDNDGVVRRVPLALSLAGQPVSTFTAELLRVGQGVQNIIFKTHENSGLSELRIGELSVPTNAHGEIWVHYSRPLPERYIPAWKLLSGDVPAAMLKDHLVLVGTSAQGLMDLRFNALGRIVPGVEIHAQALEQILSGHFLMRPSWALFFELAVMLGTVLLVSLLALRARALVAAGVSAVVMVGIFAGGWLCFRQYGLLFNTVTPTLVLAATFVAGSLIHHFVSEREQRWIKSAFSRYVSPNRVAYLVAHRDAMALGGRKQECSFVFTDLEGFTGLMENTAPTAAVQLLNNYLDEMIAIAFRHEGTLDRIVGDAVAIMFSAPVPQADHRRRALACALEMDAFARRYREKMRNEGVPWGRTRIGIHAGEVVVGNFGGKTMFDYRALGDAVNTVARLESVNKYLGTTLCLSEAALSECPAEVAMRPVGRLLLKGKRVPLQVFEPVSASCAAGYAPLAAYLDAYAVLAEANENAKIDGRGRENAALAAFRRLAQDFPDDPLVALHCGRLQSGALGDLIVMDSK